MISPRQKLRLDSEVPVLFSLPNLRMRGAHPSVDPSPETSVPAANATLRVDPPAPTAVPEVQAKVSEAEPVAATTVAPSLGAHPASQSRSWMERVGSRLILVVTLMVIVTAAWITGRRMPASKPDPWNDSSSVESDVAATNKNQPAESAALNSAAQQRHPVQSPPTSSAVATSASVEPSVGVDPPSAPASAWSPEDAHSHLPAGPREARTADLQSPSTSDSPQFADASHTPSPSFAPQAPAESLPVFNTVSMQSPASTAESTAASTSAESISLDPPMPTSPAVDNSSSNGPTGNATSTVQTGTPHAPVVDPEVLLPWFHEQVAARNYRKSTTPNAIADWSRYLPPTTGGDTQVRAASSNEPTGAPVRAQQAAVPHGIVTNPYSQ